MKDRVSRTNFKILTQGLKETYILSNQPLKSINKKRKEPKVAKVQKEDGLETERLETSRSRNK
jgi:hypothetical protein